MKAEKTEYQLHAVRIREDYWQALIPILQGDGYHNSFQDFVEQCIVEKAGLNGNIELEIRKTEADIKRMQELNTQRMEIFKTRQAEAAKELEKKVIESRMKELRRKKAADPHITIDVFCPECGTKQMMMRQSSSRKCCGCKKEIKKEDWLKEELKKI